MALLPNGQIPESARMCCEEYPRPDDFKFAMHRITNMVFTADPGGTTMVTCLICSRRWDIVPVVEDRESGGET